MVKSLGINISMQVINLVGQTPEEVYLEITKVDSLRETQVRSLRLPGHPFP